MFLKEICNAVKKGENIIIDKTNLTKKSRNRILNSINLKGYKVEFKVFTTSLNVAQSRRKFLDVSKFVKFATLPTLKECDEIEFI